jgi:hypothetical protein
MGTMKISIKYLRQLAVIVMALVGLLSTLMQIWYDFGISVENMFSILAIIALGVLVLAFIWACRDVSRLESLVDEIEKESPIEFLTDEMKAGRTLTEMLENTEDSLHYFGGAGLIGERRINWRETLRRKLEDKDFKMVRLIDLKTIQELREIFKPEGDKAVEGDIEKYVEWLEIHSKHLESTAKENLFFNFAGAPLWKYGINYVIFDEEHLAITFIYRNRRKAIIIRNRSDIAKEVVKSILYLRDRFELKSLKSETLEGIARGEIPREELTGRSHET